MKLKEYIILSIMGWTLYGLNWFITNDGLFNDIILSILRKVNLQNIFKSFQCRKKLVIIKVQKIYDLTYR